MNIVLVDERDCVIGIKERTLIDPVNDIYRVSALWITNSKGQILLARRSKQKKIQGGLWGPAAAGTNDEGETYESNIRKEATEELGLANLELTVGPKLRMSSGPNFFCQWFFMLLDLGISDFKLQTEEVDEVKWVTSDFLRIDYSINPSNYIPDLPLEDLH